MITLINLPLINCLIEARKQYMYILKYGEHLDFNPCIHAWINIGLELKNMAL